MRTQLVKSGMLGMLVLSLAACGTTSTGTGYGMQPTASTSQASNVTGYGTVQSIESVPRQNAGIGLGTVAGAVVGGLLGHQVGGGSGQTAATVAGAAGGALAGGQVQKNMQGNSGDVYRISILMDNGTAQTLIQPTQPNLRIGDRVHIQNGVVDQVTAR